MCLTRFHSGDHYYPSIGRSRNLQDLHFRQHHYGALGLELTTAGAPNSLSFDEVSADGILKLPKILLNIDRGLTVTSTLICRSLDIVAELRLRQWARRNYVPATERVDDDWHPVVLKEMQRKDSELAGDGPVRMVITSSGVAPLEPSRHAGMRIDTAHASLSGPRISSRSSQTSGVARPTR